MEAGRKGVTLGLSLPMILVYFCFSPSFLWKCVAMPFPGIQSQWEAWSMCDIIHIAQAEKLCEVLCHRAPWSWKDTAFPVQLLTGSLVEPLVRSWMCICSHRRECVSVVDIDNTWISGHGKFVQDSTNTRTPVNIKPSYDLGNITHPLQPLAQPINLDAWPQPIINLHVLPQPIILHALPQPIHLHALGCGKANPSTLMSCHNPSPFMPCHDPSTFMHCHNLSPFMPCHNLSTNLHALPQPINQPSCLATTYQPTFMPCHNLSTFMLWNQFFFRSGYFWSPEPQRSQDLPSCMNVESPLLLFVGVRNAHKKKFCEKQSRGLCSSSIQGWQRQVKVNTLKSPPPHYHREDTSHSANDRVRIPWSQADKYIRITVFQKQLHCVQMCIKLCPCAVLCAISFEAKHRILFLFPVTTFYAGSVRSISFRLTNAKH